MAPVNTKPTTIRELAQAFGLITDGSPDWALRIEITALLRILANDVSAAQDIDDNHPRFFEHSILVAVWGDLDPMNQKAIDGTRWIDTTQANRVERQAIRDLQARFL